MYQISNYIVEIDKYFRKISSCNISRIPEKIFRLFRMVKVIDISYNQLETIDITDLAETYRDSLENLQLSGNALQNLTFSKAVQYQVITTLLQIILGIYLIITFQISVNSVWEIIFHLFRSCKDIRNNQIDKLTSRCFKGLIELKIIQLVLRLVAITYDIRNALGNHLAYLTPVSFYGPPLLLTVITEREYLCCMVPAKVRICQPSMYSDTLSSCYRLLAHITLQTFIWIVGGLALLGNVLVLIQNYHLSKRKRKSVPTFLVSNLAVSDLIMSLYLMIIAIADLMFTRGDYGIKSETWLSHPACLIACFFVTLSSLTSVFIMIIISTDRYICIVYPFSTKRMTVGRAKIALGVLWSFSIIFSAVPVLFSIQQPGYLRIYKYSSMCMPNNYQNFYFKIWMISYLAMTFMAWIIMIILYVRIFFAVKESSKNIRKSSTTDNKALAVRLALILVSDLVTWVPYYYISVAGLLKDGQVDTVALQFIATFVLPLNSAINPYLYTLTSVEVIRLIFKRRPETGVTSTFTRTQKVDINSIYEKKVVQMETFVNEISDD
ncbi:G-protein coupled receptor GRL101-like protein [Trichoplax sp. H2]|nr:G-protein coupled receptor GRL101-like protein [Trichoplax sp. H2]|eukprot:RDD37483.1 G-protein coupled receptor GRL101-like protein [Trichoplax sp. H2]